MASPISYPRFRAFVQGTATPLSGGLLYSYVAGTSTPLATYADATQSSANPNPVVLDSNGEAWVFAGSGSYKLILQDSTGVEQWSMDNVTFVQDIQSSIAGHNLLMNGGLEIWQAATTITGAASAQTADGFAIRVAVGTGAAANYTITRQTSGRTGVYCMRVQRNNAATDSLIKNVVQNIETLDAIPAQSQYLTLSWYMRCGATYSPATTPVPAIYSGTGTDEAWQTAGSFTGQTTVTTNAITAPAISTSWQKYVYTSNILVPTTATELAAVIAIPADTGTAGASDYTEIDDVQLEFGTAATNFDRQPMDRELARVQRRFYKSFPQATVPAQNAGTSGAYVFQNTVGAATAMGTPSLPIPPNMRDVAGTMTTYNPSVANAQARNFTRTNDCSATTAVVSSNEAHMTLTSSAGSVLGDVNMVHYIVDKRI